MKLGPRWTKLRHHPEQWRLWTSRARFRVVPAGRRSGKTELAKRFGVLQACIEDEIADLRIGFGAPTHDQARDLYWEDLKALVPREFVVGRPNETRRELRLVNGATLFVAGLDRPERWEGAPLDGVVLDEYANMKEHVWPRHIRPALSTPGRRPGWAWFIGVPEGRNHYYALYRRALELREQAIKEGRVPEWDGFTWESATVVSAAEIEAAMRDLDALTFAQEYKASFVDYAGRAYYTFDRDRHALEALSYVPKLPLILCFDFNRSPGVAVVLQEQDYHPLEPLHRPEIARQVTAAIGEVFIPKNSNTPAVVNRLIQDWGKHPGIVRCYGDRTGGNLHTQSTEGSDWDIIEGMLRPVFKDRLEMMVTGVNPAERARLNAMNSRIQPVGGPARFLVDPGKCPHLIEDLEGTMLLEGGSGEIDKPKGTMLTHMTDALGYYVEQTYPIISRDAVIEYGES
jgi:hypothetical protein